MIGRTISHYRVLEKLGAGGMAVVYKAHDERLGRNVALKFLSGSSQPEAAERLLQEARAASALDHPNICTVYEIAESDDGRQFIAMAYYEGETLGERLLRGKLPVEEAVDVAAGIARGLHTAHRGGIVHQDVKPHNVMLVADSTSAGHASAGRASAGHASAGRVKILDFGLARLDGKGKVFGTASYMAPERFYKGREADPRSDIWSLGVVLYEMVSGEHPFQRLDEEQTVHAIRYQPLMPITGYANPLGVSLNALLSKALERDLERRYADMGAMIRDLEALLYQLTPKTRTQPVAQLPEPQGDPGHPSIAVLPFTDQSPEHDQEHLCYGIAEELVRLLTSMSRFRVASFISVGRSVAEGVSPVELGERLRVKTVLEGSVYKAEQRLRVMVRLVRVRDGRCLWSEKYDRQFKELFDIQDEIAERIVLALEITLMKNHGEVSRSRDHEAYDLLLKGRLHWNRRTEEATVTGIGFFEQAIGRDPRYARAWAGLADSYTMQCIYSWKKPGDVMSRARDAAQQALASDAGLADAHASRACVRAVYDWDFAGAERDFERAIALDPSYAIAYQWYAMNALLPVGRFDEAHARLLEARESDPLSLPVASSLGIFLFYCRRYDEAIAELEKALEIDSTFVPALVFLSHCHAALERYEEARRELEQAEELAGPRPDLLAGRGHILAAVGAGDEVREVLDQLYRMSQQRYVSPSLRAQVYVALGRRRVAIDALRAAVDVRAADVIWLGLHPFLEPLYDEPDFQTLLAMVGLDTFPSL